VSKDSSMRSVVSAASNSLISNSLARCLRHCPRPASLIVAKRFATIQRDRHTNSSTIRRLCPGGHTLMLLMAKLGRKARLCLPDWRDRSRLAMTSRSRGGVCPNHFARRARRSPCVNACYRRLIVVYRYFPLYRRLCLRAGSKQTRRTLLCSLDRISSFLRASVIVSEDARFCEHEGVDWSALREVMDRRMTTGPRAEPRRSPCRP